LASTEFWYVDGYVNVCRATTDEVGHTSGSGVYAFKHWATIDACFRDEQPLRVADATIFRIREG
jgi:hypothetical protein